MDVSTAVFAYALGRSRLDCIAGRVSCTAAMPIATTRGLQRTSSPFHGVMTLITTGQQMAWVMATCMGWGHVHGLGPRAPMSKRPWWGGKRSIHCKLQCL